MHNLSDHFNVMERALRDSLAPRGETAAESARSASAGSASAGAAAAGSAFAEGMTPEVRDALAADEVFAALVVQRSRSYAKKSQVQQRGESAVFPVRKPPVVAEYSIRRSVP